MTQFLSAAPSRTPTDVATPARADAVTYLTLWLVLLYGISAYQVVPGLGDIGSPAMLLAIPTLFLWAGGWLFSEPGPQQHRHPVRSALLLYLAYQVTSFAVASTRPLTPLESTGSVRSLLTMLAMAGVGLLVADGVRSLEGLTTLLRRLAVAITLVSAFGIAQFFTDSPMQVLLPGLEWNHAPVPLDPRGPFGRPSATSLHPIEFSVITASLLPLVLHFALYGRTKAQRRRFGLAAAVVAFAVPISVSRSGVVSLGVAMAILLTGWKGRRLANGLLAPLVAIPILWAAIPGLVGTLIGLFTGTDDDVSIQARIRRVPRIMALIRERPWFGLGNGTWSVEDYFLVDSELYVTTLETGIVGIVLTAALLLLGAAVAFAVRSLPTAQEETRHLALALCASIAGLSISLATFDSFHYRILTSTLFMLLGAVGSLWALHDGSRHFAAQISRTWHRDRRKPHDSWFGSDPGAARPRPPGGDSSTPDRGRH